MPPCEIALLPAPTEPAERARQGPHIEATHRFRREELQSIDYGLDFYAAQTLLTPDGRRIMVAWMQNWDTCVVVTALVSRFLSTMGSRP